MPLLHEQHFPDPVGSHDHTIIRFEQAERRLHDDETPGASKRRSEMQAWRRRHALWSGAAGGIVPNIWIRRQSDLCEIAYDPGPPVGAPVGFEFQFNRGATLLDAGVVEAALSGFRAWVAKRDPSSGGSGRQMRAFNEPEALAWMLGPHLAHILEKAGLPSSNPTNGVVYPSPPEVAMFGSLTPQLSEEDASILLAALDDAKSDEPEAPLLTQLVTSIGPPTRESSWDQGYEFAIAALNSIEQGNCFIDIEGILGTLGVTIVSHSVSDFSLRGVAIAGDGFRPTIVINDLCPRNKTMPGRRFTLAHELCHLLYDRGQARRVTHSSSPWAPEPVERRANAFAAMLLMPYRLVDAALAQVGRITTEHHLKLVAERLRCSKPAVLEHLRNIARLDATFYFRLKAEAGVTT